MKITRISSTYYSWQRPVAITNGLHTYGGVRLCIVKVETDEGVTGIGIGGAKSGERQFRAAFSAKLVGADPMLTEAIWSRFWMPKLYGRRGFETRALSSIDLALWDLKAKVAGLPLYQMLGGYRSRIPTDVAGGCYAEGKGLKELQAEMVGYVERGAKAVKMKIGAVPVAEDVARIQAVRSAIGPDIKLMIDANCAYRQYEAIQLARRVEDQDIFWFVEAVQPDDYDGMRRIAQATTIPLATGENEYTKHGFRDLIGTQAISILRPDARHMGG